jgi:hypothetical protein
MSTAWDSHDFRIKCGATWRDQVVLRDDAGALINLTGYTANLRARREWDSAGALDVDLDETAGLTLGGVAGTIDIELDTASLDGTYRYDLFITSSGGVVEAVLEGRLIIGPRVTP